MDQLMGQRLAGAGIEGPGAVHGDADAAVELASIPFRGAGRVAIGLEALHNDDHALLGPATQLK